MIQNIYIKFKSIVLGLFIIVLLFGISSGCHKKESAASPTTTVPGTNEVFIQNTSFGPSSITVAVNATVKWTNKDGFAHTVTSDAGLFDSGTIASNGTYSHQFTTAGTYPFHCSIHSSMTGRVVVQ
jgi:plastocyanin